MAAHEAEPATGGLRSELAPYLPTRRTLAVPLRALGAGTGVLLGRGLGWVRGDVWPRLGYVAGGGYLAVHTAAQYGQAAPYAAVGGACVWCVAAWLAAPADAVEDLDEEPADEPSEGTSEAGGDGVAVEEFVEDAPEADPVAAGALLQLLHDCIGHGNGVHLADALATLHHHGMLADWTVTDLRAQVEALGVRVRPSLKVGGRVRVGVHRDDLTAVSWTPPPPSSEGAPVGVVSAGHSELPAETTSRATPRLAPLGGGAGDPVDAHFEDALDLIRPTPAPTVRRTA